jgi:hypothetical protein
MSSQADDIGFMAEVARGIWQYRQTGSGAMNLTLTVDQNIVIKSIALHLSAAGGASENFVAQVDSDAGSAYDTKLLVQDMNTTTDIFDTTERYIPAGDDIDFTYTNTNARTWGLTVQYGKVGT